MNKVIYYRGEIDFCNYACSYCPFAKSQTTNQRQKKLEREAQRLEKLLTTISQEKADLMITPYGEALIQPIYQQFLIDISKLPTLNKVGIQTNLSLDIEKWLRLCESQQAELEKIMVWATLHSEYADLSEFANKVNRLWEKMNISAGMVATLDNIEEIKALRSKLKPEIYLWLNPIAQRKAKFKPADIEELSQIDPLFSYEFYQYRQQEIYQGKPAFQTCGSYQHQYISLGKDNHQCFFKNKQAKSAIPENCHNHKRCDCYLGFSNFKDSKITHFFGENQVFRIPEKPKFKGIFIDFDGVITTSNQQMIPNLKIILESLSAKSKPYLATARNLKSVQKKLKSDFRFFQGGVFSDGCLIIDQSHDYQYMENISITSSENEQELKQLAMTNSKIKLDYFQNKVLRISMPTIIANTEEMGNQLQNLMDSPLKLREYGNRSFYQSKKASKEQGIWKIMKENQWQSHEVLVISDNIQDLELFTNFPYTATPLHAKKLAKYSYYDLNFNHIPMIVG